MHGRWVWLHLEDNSAYLWDKPKVKIHKMRKNGLSAWWKGYTYQKEYSDCFLYAGKADVIINPIIFMGTRIQANVS